MAHRTTISMSKDKIIPNSAIFLINKEDDTLGSLIHCQLQKHPNVVSASYKKPKYNVDRIFLRIQTKSEDYSPSEALNDALTDLISEVSTIETKFKEEIVGKPSEAP